MGCLQATLKSFPETTHQFVPNTLIEDVFSSVQNGKTSFGVVPIENSTNGAVMYTLDLLADAKGKHPDILVHGEIYLPVHHCLLGHAPKKHAANATSVTRLLEDEENAHAGSGTATPTEAAPRPKKPRAQPLHDLSHITKLYSHSQAWGQCKTFVSTFLKNVERQDVSSTSRAAEVVAQDDSGATAAISSKLAADINGLDVLAESIEDNEGNSTRFFILQRKENAPAFGECNSIDVGTEMREFKSMVSFTVDHGEAGALADCWAVFKRHKINLTSINTMPSGDAPWHYIFLVELVGRKLGDGKGGAVNEALEDLSKVAKSWRWLGSWRSAKKEEA